MGASLSVNLSQTGKNETNRTATVSVIVNITSTGGTHNHIGSSSSGNGAILYVTIDGNTYSSYVTFGSSDTGTYTSTVYANSFTVSYNSSGTGSVSVSARCITNTSAGTISGSDSLSLTPISSSGGSSDGDIEDDTESGGDGSGSGSGGITPNSGNCTVVGQYYFYREEDSLNYNKFASFTLSNDSYMPKVVAIKFTTPSFVGVSNSLDVNLNSTMANFTIDDYSICFALCDSDENHNMYLSATSVVNDTNQIKFGSLSRQAWTSMPFSIQTNGLKGNTDYYLIFWIPSDIGFTATAEAATSEYHGITLNYTASGGGDSGGSSDEDSEYRYLWIQKVEGTNVSVSLYENSESSENYVDISDTAEERSDDNGLWYVFKLQSNDFFRFNIYALSGYTLGEINTTGLQYDEEYDDYGFLSDNAFVFVEVTNGNSGSTRGVLYIDNGVEFGEYECYIDNGISWDLYVLYIDNGTTWEQL